MTKMPRLDEMNAMKHAPGFENTMRINMIRSEQSGVIMRRARERGENNAPVPPPCVCARARAERPRAGGERAGEGGQFLVAFVRIGRQRGRGVARRRGVRRERYVCVRAERFAIEESAVVFLVLGVIYGVCVGRFHV